MGDGGRNVPSMTISSFELERLRPREVECGHGLLMSEEPEKDSGLLP